MAVRKSNLCCEPATCDVDLQDFEAVADLIDKINKKLFRIHNEFITSFGVTPQQYYILRHLWVKDGIPLNELAKVHGTAKSTITGIVDTMEKNGLVFRDRGSDDRRVILIRLTKKGKALQNQTLDLLAITNKCCAELNSEDVKQLRDLLDKFNSQITL
ncbi:MAG: MarR family winged helix-turn-helix transcriptional regulator [bacterium]